MGDVLDEALGVFGDTGPEYDAFDGRFSFANHGPMVVEALCAMGREDAVMEWAMRYRPRLAPRPLCERGSSRRNGRTRSVI